MQKIELNQLIHSFRFLPSRYAMSCCRNGDVQSVRSPTTEARFVFEKKENPTRVTKMKKKSGAKKKSFRTKENFEAKQKKSFWRKSLVSCRFVLSREPKDWLRTSFSSCDRRAPKRC